jgi:Glyoxalase/Bleomycin resistance protein/Dioxygenase superfamily
MIEDREACASSLSTDELLRAYEVMRLIREFEERVHVEFASFTWIGADAHAGDTWIELLQPLEGESPLSEWLAANGDGVHHLGYEVPDVETAQRLHRSFEQQGLSELLSAFCGGMYFYFMDAAPLVIEVWAGSAETLTPARIYP